MEIPSKNRMACANTATKSKQNKWHCLRTAGVLPVAGIVAGWFMPEFYDWTGADQSRPAPVVGWIALAIAAANLLLWGILFWWPTSADASITIKSRSPTVGCVLGAGGYLFTVRIVRIARVDASLTKAAN